MDNVQKVKFEGISVRLDLIAWILKYFLQGTVAFSSDTGDRMALTMVEQLVGTKYQIVGYYDMRTDNLTLNKNSSGGTRELSWVNNYSSFLLQGRKLSGGGEVIPPRTGPSSSVSFSNELITNLPASY